MSSSRRILRYRNSVAESQDGPLWRSRSGSAFFRSEVQCTYCGHGMRKVYTNSRRVESPPEDVHEWWLDDSSVSAHVCEDCGWWYVEDRTDHEDNDSDDFRWSVIGYRRGVLEVHDLCSPSVPIQALAQELKSRGDSIYHTHPRAMEKLVAGVLREHYPGCEVELCGRGPDGGIDLYIVLAGKTIGVQVKRRARPDKPEVVSTVRDFFGACVAKKLRDLVFITTAEHFTGSAMGAEPFARQVVDDRIVDSFDLVNAERFLSMLNLIDTGTEAEPWRAHIW